MSNFLDQAKYDFGQALQHLEKELHALRAGRANASMVENLAVEAYGSTMEMKGLASITIPDAKTIQIEPWDKNVVKDIEKAIQGSGLGLNPNIAGTIIRLVMPPLTEENRKNLVKVINQKAEHARITIRTVRESIRESIAADEKAKRLSEDEKFRLQEQLDKIVSEWNQKVEELSKEKEAEVMTV